MRVIRNGHFFVIPAKAGIQVSVEENKTLDSQSRLSSTRLSENDYQSFSGMTMLIKSKVIFGNKKRRVGVPFSCFAGTTPPRQ